MAKSKKNTIPTAIDEDAVIVDAPDVSEQSEPTTKTSSHGKRSSAEEDKNSSPEVELNEDVESAPKKKKVARKSSKKSAEDTQPSPDMIDDDVADAGETVEEPAVATYEPVEAVEAPSRGTARKVKSKTKRTEVGDLFASVPDADEIAELTPIEQIDEEELARIEAEAIAALPHAEVEPELLLYESDEIEDTHESAEEAARYEAFLTDYKDVMARMLSMAKDNNGGGDRDDSELGDISDFIIDDEFDGDIDEEDDDEEYLTAEEIEAISLGDISFDPADVADPLESPDDDDDESTIEVNEAEAVAEEAAPEVNEAEVVAEEAAPEVDEAEAVAEEVAPEVDQAEVAAEEVAPEVDQAEVAAEEVAPEVNEAEIVAEEAAPEVDEAEAVAEEVAPEVDEAEAVAEEAAPEVDEAEVAAEEAAPEVDETEEEITDTSLQEVKAKLNVSGSDNFPDISLLEYIPRPEPEVEAEDVMPENEGEVAEVEMVQLEMDFGEDEMLDGENDEDDEALDDSAADSYEEKITTYDPKKPRFIDTVFDTLELFVFTFAIVMIITTFFVRHSRVDGFSMTKTLDDGDIVIISNLFYTPERGDIVVLEDSSVHPTPLVKRVIGVEGDTVEITRSGEVIVNGERLVEEYVYMNFGWQVKPSVWKIGKGEIFILGDHRNESRDSEEFGPVKADSVIGKVLFRLFPFDNFGAIE